MTATNEFQNQLFSTESKAQDDSIEDDYGKDDLVEDGQFLHNKFSNSLQGDEETCEAASGTNGNNNSPEKNTEKQSGKDTVQMQTLPIIENRPKAPSPPNPPYASSLSARRSPRVIQAKPVIDESSVELVCTQCINNGQVTESDPNVLAAAVIELENTRNDLMSAGHIKESLDHQKAIDRAKEALTIASKTQAQKEYMNNIIEKKKAAERQIAMLNQSIQEAEKEFTMKSKESMDQLSAQQKKQLDQYDSEWQSDAKIRQYNRISAKLRGLRHQQDLLLAARRFDEADQVMKLADYQEKIETQESSRLMLEAFLQGRKKLENRHEQEYDVLLASINGKRAEMRAAFASQKVACENRTKLLENEEKLARDPEHVWILTHRNDESITSQLRSQPKSCSVSTRTLAPKTYGTLSLPPLQIPVSPRVSKKME